MTIVVTRTGVSFMHNDTLVHALGHRPEKVERLSNIEWNTDLGKWTVTPASAPYRIMFSSCDRSDCLAWEKANDAQLIGIHYGNVQQHAQ